MKSQELNLGRQKEANTWEGEGTERGKRNMVRYWEGPGKIGLKPGGPAERMKTDNTGRCELWSLTRMHQRLGR